MSGLDDRTFERAFAALAAAEGRLLVAHRTVGRLPATNPAARTERESIDAEISAAVAYVKNATRRLSKMEDGR